MSRHSLQFDLLKQLTSKAKEKKITIVKETLKAWAVLLPTWLGFVNADGFLLREEEKPLEPHAYKTTQVKILLETLKSSSNKITS